MLRKQVPACKLLGASLVWLAGCFFGTPLLAASGDLDTSFGSAGKVISAYGGVSMFGPAIKVQADGKIVVAGKHYNVTNDDFVVQRYLSTGALDTGFGTGGTTVFAFSTQDDNAKALAFQTDGKILVGGEGHATGTYGQHALLRLNENGTVDTSFGVGGKVTTDFGLPSHMHAVLVQNDGRIVVAGEVYTGETNGSFAIARYLSNGVLDSSFGSGGKVVQRIGSNTNGHAIAMLPDGKMLIAGYMTNATTDKDEFILARYSASGVIDTSFGTNGYSTVAIGLGKNYCHALLLQSDGKIVLLGGALTLNANDFALARFNSNGALDTSFGSGGIVTTEFTSSGAPSSEETASGALQADGKIVVAGYSNHLFAVARYLTTGALDTSFGSGGTTTAIIGTGGDDFIKSLALQADGKIVVVGYSKNAATHNMALARFNNDSVANYSDMWWNPNESGWGMSIIHHPSTGIIFSAWYAYDANGKPTWYVMSNCPIASTSCSGDIYKTTGSPPGQTWDTSKFSIAKVGTGSFSFTDTSNAVFTYSVSGVSGTKNISRQIFAIGTVTPVPSYSDMWYVPSESGWGIALVQQYGMAFIAWYMYDANNKPVWNVVSSCPVSNNACTGDIYQTTGTYFGSPWSSQNLTLTKVGSMSLSFTDSDNATMTYTVNGISAAKTISRQMF